MSAARALLFAVACAVAVPSVAFAGPKEDEARALTLFADGKKAYQRGDFDESIRLLEEAYALKAEPVLLYNLARAHEGKNDFVAAVAAYEKYLATAGAISDRGAIEKKVESLKALIEERKRRETEGGSAAPKNPPEQPPAIAPPKDESPSRSPSPVPWVIAGLGAGGLIAGAVIGGLALAKADDAETAGSQADAIDLRDGAETFALASTITMIAGGVVLAAGGTWGIVDIVVSSKKSDAASTTLTVGASSLVLTSRW